MSSIFAERVAQDRSLGFASAQGFAYFDPHMARGAILDGRAIARSVRQAVKAEVDGFRAQYGRAPGLATILIGDNAASRVYIGTKERACRKVGIQSFGYRLPEATPASKALALIAELNARSDVNGILIQLPLPPPLRHERLVEALNPNKDVDGLHLLNQGRLLRGEDGFRPCTPLGVMRLLAHTGLPLAGQKAVVIGRSHLVGRPLIFLLLEHHVTVTCCHSRTTELANEVRQADLVIPATGQPGMIRGEWIKDGAIVIDVGISRLADGSLAGDVDFPAARERAAFITPVPGGVGPMTVAMLLKNTLKAARQQTGNVSTF